MPTTKAIRRVLIVDDDRDAADTLGLLLEELGNQVHVTYGGMQALDVATAFRPDLMLVDLAMPGIDGCQLVQRFRQMAAFVPTEIVAITGHTGPGHKTFALKAGFDAVLFKPVALTELEAVLASVVAAPASHAPALFDAPAIQATESRLPIGKARQIRQARPSKTLTQTESEAAICDGIIRFQKEYVGWRSEQIQSYWIKDLLLVRIAGNLTLAEQQLAKSASHENGRNLVKQVRRQLVELARPMLESLVHEVFGVKVLSMHHDISTVTGEEVIVFSLVDVPRIG